MTELWRLSAAELAAEYRKLRVSPVDAVEECLERCARFNPVLNAIVTLDTGGARAAAAASAARWRSGAPLSVVDGVPVTIKDNMLVAGLRATWGSRLYADYVPEGDELAVARLRAAGVVIIGKSNAPEFTLQGYTDNEMFGPTRNPWDLRLTPGGSSGGAVAGVAAGLTPLAIGTDGGGSIRRPAAHCGLVGLKPSTGRIARADGFPVILHDLEVIGAVARTTADVALAMQVMAGPDPRDRASLAFGAFEPNVSADPPPQRLLFVPRFGAAPVDPEVRDSVEEAAERLEGLGHAVEIGEAPFDVAALDRIWPVISQAGLAWLLRDKPYWRGRVGAALAAMAGAGQGLLASDYVEALDVLRGLYAALAQAFGRVDAILTPTAAALSWPARESHPTTIDGVAVGGRGHAVFTAFANASGCPGISVPCRPSRAGLPIGFQLIGRYGEDDLLLALAAQYERAYPWSHLWPAMARPRDAEVAGLDNA